MVGYQVLCDFEHGIIDGVGYIRYIISQVEMKFGFSCTPISRVYRESWESVKYQIADDAVTRIEHERTTPLTSGEAPYKNIDVWHFLILLRI